MKEVKSGLLERCKKALFRSSKKLTEPGVVVFRQKDGKLIPQTKAAELFLKRNPVVLEPSRPEYS